MTDHVTLAIAWLSATFDWDAEQTGEFLREVAAEAYDRALADVTGLPWDHTADKYPNPYRQGGA